MIVLEASSRLACTNAMFKIFSLPPAPLIGLSPWAFEGFVPGGVTVDFFYR